MLTVSSVLVNYFELTQMMKITCRFLVLASAVLFASSLPSPCFATDAGQVYRGPLTEYCHKLKKKIVTLASQFTWDDSASVDLAVNSAGKIVETKAGVSSNSKLAEQIVKGLDTIDPPPSSAKMPLWLTVQTSKNTDDIAVSARDVDFGSYMSDLQKRIKRAWFPPVGKESERVTVVFKVDGGGNLSGLRFSKMTGLPDVDKAAMAAVENAKPFAKLPDGSPDCVDIQFTFDYNVLNKNGSPSTASHSGSQSSSPSSSSNSNSGSSTSRNSDSSASAMFLREGMKALERKEYPLAIQFLESGLAVDAGNVAVKKSLAIAYTSYGASLVKSNPDMAMENFKSAKKHWPENPMTPDTIEQAKKLYGQSASTDSGVSSSGKD